MSVSWAATGRTDTFSATLVDPFTLEDVQPVELDWASTSVTYDYEGDCLAGASIALEDGADYRIGGRQHMVRIRDYVLLPDGTAHDLVLGTFFCDFSQGRSLHGREVRTLDGYSCLYRMHRDVLRDDFWRPQGYNVSQAVRDLAEADGGRLAFEPSANVERCFGRDIWFDAGEGKLEAAQEMAGWVGCELYPAPDGTVVMRARPDPATESPTYTFEDGAACVRKAGIDWGTNRSDLVNRVIYVYTDGDSTQTAVSDLPAWHPMSFENVGYHATRREVMSEEPEGGLQAACDADLAASSVEQNDLTFEAVLVPTVRVGDVVGYRNAADYTEPLDLVGQVVQMDVRALVPGAMTTYKIRVSRWC